MVHAPEPDPQRKGDDAHTVEQVVENREGGHVAKTASGWFSTASSMRRRWLCDIGGSSSSRNQRASTDSSSATTGSPSTQEQRKHRLRKAETVPVVVLDHGRRVRPHEPLGAGHDPGLLENLTDRADGGLLDRVEDPRHDGPGEGVGALDEEHLVGAADRAGPHDDRRDARQPEQVGSHVFAQAGHELRNRHSSESTVPRNAGRPYTC